MLAAFMIDCCAWKNKFKEDCSNVRYLLDFVKQTN